MNQMEERKRIEMETARQKNDKVLEEAASEGAISKKRLSKRAQKKLDKALSNKDMSELEKQVLLDQMSK